MQIETETLQKLYLELSNVIPGNCTTRRENDLRKQIFHLKEQRNALESALRSVRTILHQQGAAATILDVEAKRQEAHKAISSVLGDGPEEYNGLAVNVYGRGDEKQEKNKMVECPECKGTGLDRDATDY